MGIQRLVKDRFSHSTGDLDVRLPFWREDRKHARQKSVNCQIWTEAFADVIAAPIMEAALLVDLDEDSDLKRTRELQVHHTDDTAIPEDILSDTEAWDSDSHHEPASSGKRKRCGRRRKARARQKEWNQTVKRCANEAQFEFGPEGSQNAALMTLFECLEEDMYDDMAGCSWRLSDPKHSDSSQDELSSDCSQPAARVMAKGGEAEASAVDENNPHLHPLFASVAVAARSIPPDLANALLRFGLSARHHSPHSIGTLEAAIAEMEPVVADIKRAVALPIPEILNESVVFPAFLALLAKDASGPTGILREMHEIIAETTQSDASARDDARNLWHMLDDTRYCFRHGWQRILCDMSAVQYEVERGTRKADVNQVACSSYEHSPRAETAKEVAQREKIRELSQSDLQGLFNQRLLASRSSKSLLGSGCLG